SRVANELSDMFCALNGATRTPSCAKMRHSPATSRLLPIDDAVPTSISTGAWRWPLIGHLRPAGRVRNTSRPAADDMPVCIVAGSFDLQRQSRDHEIHLVGGLGDALVGT